MKKSIPLFLFPDNNIIIQGNMLPSHLIDQVCVFSCSAVHGVFIYVTVGLIRFLILLHCFADFINNFPSAISHFLT